MVKPFLIISLGVFIGYLFGCFYKDREKFESSINDYLYYLALPITIFLKMFSFELSFLNVKFFLINSFPLLFMYLVIYLFYRFGYLSPSFSRTLMITSTLGNIVYLGFSVIGFLYGENAIIYAALSVAIQNLVIFTIGVFFLNFICYESSCIIIGFKKTFFNPIFISTFAGIFFNFLNFKMPYYIKIFLEQIEKTTLPLSIFLIGVSLYGKRLNVSYMKKILIVFLLKSFLLPFIGFCFIYLYGYFDFYSSITFILYTMPVAVASYVVSKDFNLEKDVVSGSIFFTTIMYFVLYWLYAYVLKLFF